MGDACFRDKAPIPAGTKPFSPKSTDPAEALAHMGRCHQHPTPISRVAAGYADLRRFVMQAAVENYLGDNDGLLGYAG